MSNTAEEREAVFNSIMSSIDDAVANGNLLFKEVYGIAQSLLKDRCCLCGIARSKVKNLYEVYDGQVCGGCVKSIQELGR